MRWNSETRHRRPRRLALRARRRRSPAPRRCTRCSAPSSPGWASTASSTSSRTPTKGQLCWTFDVMTHGVTGASIRDSAGMVVAKLGPTYKAKSCAAVPTKALDLIESKPGSYRVWVDTKAHMGELRGTLFAGMAHMSRHVGRTHGRDARRARGARGRSGAPSSSARCSAASRRSTGARRSGAASRRAISPLEARIPLIPIGRLADLHGLRLDAALRPEDLAARARRPRRAAGRRSPTTSCCALPKVEQVSTFHCVTGWTVKNVHWGGVRLDDVLALAEPEAGGARARVRLGRDPVRRLADARAGRPPRRDARLRDGRQAAPARARRAGPARDPGDVRLQERQVAEGDQPRAASPSDGYWEQLGYDRDAWVGRSNGYGA